MHFYIKLIGGYFTFFCYLLGKTQGNCPCFCPCKKAVIAALAKAETVFFSVKCHTGNDYQVKRRGRNILFLIPLLLCKDSEFVRFHTNQGIVLFIAGVICAIVPIIGWIASIGVLVLMVFGLINVSNGDMKELPVIGKIKILK